MTPVTPATAPVQNNKNQVQVPSGEHLVPYEPNFDDPNGDNDFDLLKILKQVEKETKDIVPTSTTNNAVMMKNSPKTTGFFTGCQIGSVHIHFDKK